MQGTAIYWFAMDGKICIVWHMVSYRDTWEVYFVLPELKQTRQQLQNSLAELSYLKTRCETAVSECQQEKQVKIEERESTRKEKGRLRKKRFCNFLKRLDFRYYTLMDTVTKSLKKNLSLHSNFQDTGLLVMIDWSVLQDNIQLRQEVEVLSQQLSQQSEYCSGLGSACCTLLWRVSKNEDTIQSILIGVKPFCLII